jgi:hypothetical protein
MRPFVQLIGKKKGTRRSGSLWWGVFADVLISSLMLLTGIVIIVAITTLQIQNLLSVGQTASILSFSVKAMIGLVLLIAGGYRIMRTLWDVGPSAERRGAIVSLARDVELLNELQSRRSEMPNVPDFHSLEKTAGKHLKYQLSHGRLSFFGLWATGLLTLAFVVVSTILVLHSVQSVTAGKTDWAAIVFTSVHLLATSWQILQFIKLLLRNSGLGPTRIELGELPLVVGKNYRLFISQRGRIPIKMLDVELICLERATFSQGTDIRTETKTVFEQRLLRKRGIALSADRPFESDFELPIPAAAMHSFLSINNQVSWRIRVTCLAKGWPKFERQIPIVICPPSVAA